MPKFLSVLIAVVALGAFAALVFAQETSPAQGKLAASATASETTTDQSTPSESSGEKPSGKPGAKSGGAGASLATLPSGESLPTPTPKPHRRSFFEWLFGSHRHKEPSTPATTPISANPASASRRSNRRLVGTPEPSSTVKPSPTPKRIHGPRPETTPAPENPTTPKPESNSTPKPDKSSTPKPVDVAPATNTPPPATPRGRKTPKPKNTPVPAASENAAPTKPPESADTDTKEEYRFEVAKSKALDDPQVKALKDKADLATTEEESRAALRAYNKELFAKIRKIDPGVSDYSEQLEKAILKRLGE